jgi:hypothetical protein
VNLYRPGSVPLGDPSQAGLWIELLHKVYPEDADHLIMWFAQRVQHPAVKINHAIVLGGVPNIGKDTMIEPVKQANGPWNFAEASPKQVSGRFNGFVKSVILRISEARDLGDVSRYDFYEHMKVYTAAPPDVIRVDEKNLREQQVWNVCGVLYTTNNETTGLYLPPNDRRHYVTWSKSQPSDFEPNHWINMYGWYAHGGISHVAAYLSRLDISKFDPKAPPKKTEAFWNIVDANRSAEENELSDVLDRLGNPDAVTLAQLVLNATGELVTWLSDRKNARAIPLKLKSARYVPHRNPTALADGMWKIKGKRQMVYVREDLSVRDASVAVAALIKQLDAEGNPHEKA